VGWFSKLFSSGRRVPPFRWSLYIARNREWAYAMHGNSIGSILGYVMGRYADGKKPKPEWTLSLEFNRNKTIFELTPDHFSKDGDDISPLMKQTIQQLDPEYVSKGEEPIFLEFPSQRRLQISSLHGAGDVLDPENLAKFLTSEKYLNSIGDDKKAPTFFDVMDQIFG